MYYVWHIFAFNDHNDWAKNDMPQTPRLNQPTKKPNWRIQKLVIFSVGKDQVL